MSTHQIKINKANKLAPALPMANAEIMDSISDTLIERLTASELAEVKRCLHRHWQKALAHKEREIVADGYVWSAKHQALLDVQYPQVAQ